MSETKHIIKKYPNRRLYDAHFRRYVTLADVKQLVVDHIEFEVVDVKTKKIITQTILLQIIADEEANSDPLFTKDILQDFIRSYHEKSQTVFTHYLTDALQLFMQQKEFVKSQMQSYQSLMMNPPLLHEMMKIQKEWLQMQITPHSKKDKNHGE